MVVSCRVCLVKLINIQIIQSSFYKPSLADPQVNFFLMGILHEMLTVSGFLF